MGRNFHQGKDYEFEHNKASGTITCRDGGDQIFHIYDEGMETNLINAYHDGLQAGRRQGEEVARRAMRSALGLE